MIKRCWAIVMCLSVLAFSHEPLHGKEKLRIVASFSILGDMVRSVCGEHGDVVSLVGVDADAHVYEPKPSDAKLILQADAIFMNGMGFEGWMKRLFDATKTSAPIFNATSGLKPLSSHRFETVPDPHAWSSPLGGMHYIDTIMKALIQIDPDHAADFEKNAKAMMDELRTVHQWAKGEFAKLPQNKRKVITSHDAFNYLALHYDIQFHSATGVDTKSEPSAKNIAQIVDIIRAENIKAVFVENITNPVLMEQIAEETGIEIGGILYSDALSPMNGPAPTYLKLLKHNLMELLKTMGQTMEQPAQAL
jgi:zinc/manganese transport system substrate-binding protein